MKRYQDTKTGEIWEFEEDQDPSSIPGIPKTLSKTIKNKPTETHIWKKNNWVLDSELVTEQMKVFEIQILGRRNAMLSSSDWIVTKSAEKGLPVPQEWQDYRQALRDITSQEHYPNEVIWPVEPTTKV